MALFITFEGGEGSGKSFQAKSIYKRLSKQKIPVVLTHEPGGTQLGEYVRQILKWTNAYISPETELLMFNASRAQLLNEVILPNIKAEKVVICDRYIDSTIAYQGYGREIDIEMVNSINNFTIRGLKPDLTILLDIPPQEGLTRIVGREKDRFERENIVFHQRVRDGYLKMAADEPERWLVIDASQSKDKIRQIIWRRVSQLLLNNSTET
jgi:dTMP kinase